MDMAWQGSGIVYAIVSNRSAHKCNRQKSERLRHILCDKAESHFDNYLKTNTASAEGESICSLSIVPLYPEEPLTDYKRLPELIKYASTRAPYGIMADPEFPLIPVQDGATVISNKRGIYKMTEFNSYGLVLIKCGNNDVIAIKIDII